jgi:hypothetical protein
LLAEFQDIPQETEITEIMIKFMLPCRSTTFGSNNREVLLLGFCPTALRWLFLARDR